MTLQGAATGRIQRYVIPEPRITLQFTWWIHCHVSRATCRIAGCSHLAKSMSWSCRMEGVIIPSAILKIVFRHIYFFRFFNAVWALTSGGFHIVSDTFCLSVCLSVSKMQKTRFSKNKLSNLQLWYLLTTCRKSYMGFSKNPLLDP